MFSITGLPAFVKEFLQAKSPNWGAASMGEGACASTPFLKEPRALVLLPEEITEMKTTGRHHTLPDLVLPDGMMFTESLEEVMEDKEVLEALGRVLSGEGTVCANSEETQIHELATRGESLIRGAGEEE